MDTTNRFIGSLTCINLLVQNLISRTLLTGFGLFGVEMKEYCNQKIRVIGYFEPFLPAFRENNKSILGLLAPYLCEKYSKITKT